MKSTQQGWVKIHRQILEWEWYDEPNVFRLFMHCILKANHEDKNYRGTIVKRGTFLTSLEILSKETGLTVRSVRTSLKKLESTSEVTSVRTSKGTVIQIVKYNDYQLVTSEVTNERQASDKQVTTNKNEKNEKKFNAPTFSEVKEYCIERKNNVDAQRFLDFYSSKGWMIGKNKMKDWKAAVRTWEKEDHKQPKQSTVGLPNMDYIKQQIALNNDTKQGK